MAQIAVRRGLNFVPGRCCLWLIVLSYPLFPVSAPAADDIRVSRTSPAVLRIFAASNVDKGCGAAIPQSRVQEELESQLRSAGVSVARANNAGLSADIDCVPTIAPGQASSMVVHECLVLSQVVSLPGEDRRVAAATTWRQCQAYRCSVGKCDALMRSSLHGLLEAFMTDFRERVSTTSDGNASIPGVQSNTPAGVRSAMNDASVLNLVRLVYYSLYILACLVMFVRWQFSKQLR